MNRRSDIRNWRRALLAGTIALGLVGCNEGDEVRQYRIPALADADDLPPPAQNASARSEQRPSMDMDLSDHEPRRMVVTIVEESGRNWFFRMLGPSSAIDEEIRHFISFMHSVEFSGGANSTPRFDAAPHWEPLPASGMRFAAFRFGSEDDPIELTIVPLGPEAGDLLANVNRWRGQLNLPPITEAHLHESATPVTLGGREITLVDLVSSHQRAPMHDDAMTDLDPHTESRTEGNEFTGAVSSITYDVPAGWTEREATGMRQASFTVTRDNEDIVDVSVIALPGEAGGLLANVNFWRGQLGLNEIDEQQLPELLHTLTIDGNLQATSVDLTNEEPFDERASETPSGSTPQRIIAAIHARSEHTWFIKMTGPHDVLTEHKQRFEAFVASIRFGEEGVE